MATVYYWKWGKTNVGHLSLGLDDGTYISLWPEEDAMPWSLPMRGRPHPSLRSDIDAEGGPPDKTLPLPQGMVDCHKIRQWWEETMKRGTTYQLVFSNCAQMVQSALAQGGILKYDQLIVMPTGRHPQELHKGPGSPTPLDVLLWIEHCIHCYKNPGRYPLNPWRSLWDVITGKK